MLTIPIVIAPAFPSLPASLRYVVQGDQFATSFPLTTQDVADAFGWFYGVVTQQVTPAGSTNVALLGANNAFTGHDTFTFLTVAGAGFVVTGTATLPILSVTNQATANVFATRVVDLGTLLSGTTLTIDPTVAGGVFKIATVLTSASQALTLNWQNVVIGGEYEFMLDWTPSAGPVYPPDMFWGGAGILHFFAPGDDKVMTELGGGVGVTYWRARCIAANTLLWTVTNY